MDYFWFIAALAMLVLTVASALAIIGPIYGVWQQTKAGEADLARARLEQQIQITEAENRYRAAELNKKAAVIEAQAVAEQIKTIGEGLNKHDLYLRWQWIKMMEDRDGETIYVPTEANLPILEAGKRP